MTLDLTKLATSAKPAPMVKAKRGRTAEPIPDAILKLVQDSYDLPEDEGMTLPVPHGDVDDNGKDGNVTSTISTLRRAADQLGLGLSVSAGERGGRTTPVSFRAQDRRIVRRAPAPDDIYVVESDEEITEAESAATEGARLATVPEARALGYVWTEAGGWAAGE